MFSDIAKCRSDQYKTGALCYKKCSTYGETPGSLVDCTWDACSSDSSGCISTTINMAAEIAFSIASIALLIGTAGASAPLSAAGRALMKKMGANAIKKLQKSTVRGIYRAGVDKFKKAATKSSMKAFAKSNIR